MTLTPEEAGRVHVLPLLEGKRITPAEAAGARGLTPRQVRRRRGGLRQEGPAALVHGNRGRPAPTQVPATLRTQIVALARGRSAGLTDHHLPETLTALAELPVSRAPVQRILRAAGLASPRRRRPPRPRSRRPRKAQAGLLAQLDGSPCAWFGPTQPVCSLLAAPCRAPEDAAGSRRLLDPRGRTVGLPAALYTDGHGIFVRHAAHWTLAEELQGFQEPPQVGRALQALGIHHLVAESPPAKGRSARRWTTLQDRLVAELARAGLPPLATGDAFLVTPGLPACTTQFAGPPPGAVSASRPVPRSRDLDRACAFHSARPVALENPVRGADVVLHLPPGPPRRSSARAPADVVQCLDGSWRVYVGDRLVAATSAPLDPGQLRARTRR